MFMEVLQSLTRFFFVAREDHRIGPTHISVYMALLHLYDLNHLQNPVPITRSQVMTAAKIRGLATYHKCIRDLAAFDYIRYLPSVHPGIRSRVVLLSV